MKYLKYALIVLLSSGILSCGSSSDDDDEPEVDNTAPTVTITSPTNSTVINAGGDLSVNFTATDNVELSSYTLTIGFSGPKSVKTVEEYSFNSVTDKDSDGNDLPTISGTNAPVEFDVEIAANAKPGNYKLTIEVKDSSNNTKSAEVIFEVQ